MSKLVEDTEEEKFDPTQFLLDDTQEAGSGDSGDSSEDAEDLEDQEGSEDISEEDDDDESWNFDDDKGEDDEDEEDSSGAAAPVGSEEDEGSDATDSFDPDNDEFLDTLNSELGLEASNFEDAIQKIKLVIKKKEELESQIDEVVKYGSKPDPAKEKLKDLLGLEDDELVKENLRAEGFDDDEIEEQFEEIESQGLTEGEAMKIRRDIKIAIKRREKDRILKAKEEEAQQEQQRAAWNGNVKAALSKTEQFMGTKLGKTQSDTQKIVDKVFDSYSKGAVFREMTSTPENVAEVCLLWSLRNQLKDKLLSKGANRERKRIIVEDFGNPNSGRGGGELPKPSESETFDPRRFAGY